MQSLTTYHVDYYYYTFSSKKMWCKCLCCGVVNTSLQKEHTFTTPLVGKNVDIDYTFYNTFGNKKIHTSTDIDYTFLLKFW